VPGADAVEQAASTAAATATYAAARGRHIARRS
jgi:hypothetical protein